MMMAPSVQGAKLDIPLREPNHPDAYFPEEADGWHGYVEWEKYPEKKAQAAKIFAQYSFAEVRCSSPPLRSSSRLLMYMRDLAT